MTCKHSRTLVGAAILLGGALFGTPSATAQDANAAPPATAPDATAARAALGFTSPHVALSRDAAARNFAALLQLLGQPFAPNAPNNAPPKDPDDLMMSSFSRSSENQNLAFLIHRMVVQWAQPNSKVTVQSEGDKTATVVLETAPTTVSRPLILVQEGDSWGVDVLETYAKWNDLEGPAKTAAIAQLAVEFNRERDLARRNSCQSNLKQIGLGIIQYAQDYDEKLPPGTTWMDAIMPYVKSEQLFKCPSVLDPKGFGYAMNFNFSQKELSAIKAPAEGILLYETTDLERNSYGVGEDPAFRHEDGANYCFTDGHVKWLPKTTIPSFKLNP